MTAALIFSSAMTKSTSLFSIGLMKKSFMPEARAIFLYELCVYAVTQ